jgi:hypothetical protein
MVDIVGEMPGKGGLVRVPISREFREWLLAMWRRTGGDGDMIDDVTSTANTSAATLAGMAARVAYLEDRVRSLEAERAVVAPRPPAVSDTVVWAPRW